MHRWSGNQGPALSLAGDSASKEGEGDQLPWAESGPLAPPTGRRLTLGCVRTWLAGLHRLIWGQAPPLSDSEALGLVVFALGRSQAVISRAAGFPVFGIQMVLKLLMQTVQ